MWINGGSMGSDQWGQTRLIFTTGGYLPSGNIPGAGKGDQWGQTGDQWGQTRLIFTTGGYLPSGNIPGARKRINGADQWGQTRLIFTTGGYLPSGNIPGARKGTARIAFGGWKVDPPTTDIPIPKPGLLALMAYYSDGVLWQSRSRRMRLRLSALHLWDQWGQTRLIFTTGDQWGQTRLIFTTGGYLPSGNIPGARKGTARIAFGGWKVDPPTTDIPIPKPGHLALMAYYSDGVLWQSRSRRMRLRLSALHLQDQWGPRSMGSDSIDQWGQTRLIFTTGGYLPSRSMVDQLGQINGVMVNGVRLD